MLITATILYHTFVHVHISLDWLFYSPLDLPCLGMHMGHTLHIIMLVEWLGNWQNELNEYIQLEDLVADFMRCTGNEKDNIWKGKG